MALFPLSQKYIDFVNSTKNVDADFLEGTTASGKTTVGVGVKFMLQVSRSKKKLHIIAARTTGVAEKNLIQQDNGILDIHKNAKYNGNGSKEYKLPHLQFEGKIIFVLGYDNQVQWKQVLGGQYGCVYIDEINTANIEFVREISTRNDYLMATLNPDNPALPVYDEFINRARPYKKYADDVPDSIRKELDRCEPNPRWRYWFFTFRDNLSLSEEAIQKKIASAPKGTKLYKNKILGLRGKATGLVFSNFERARHVRTADWAKQFTQKKNEFFMYFTAGVDTSYSQKSPDTIAFSFLGITNKGRCIVLDEKVYNNANLEVPLAPSDTVNNLIEFLNRNKETWGLARNVFLDNADQATKQEWNKYRRRNGCVYNLNDAWKSMQIVDRINAQLGFFAFDDDAGIEPCFFVLDTCANYISELETYSWLEDKDNTPEDGHDHMVNSVQYAWIPYQSKIFKRKKDE